MIEIKENNGGMLAILNGRLDTPAAVKAQQERLSRRLDHCLRMQTRKSYSIVQILSTSVVLVSVCS